MDESPSRCSTRDYSTPAEEAKQVDAFELSSDSAPVSPGPLSESTIAFAENTPKTPQLKKRELKMKLKRQDKIERVVQSAKLFL